MLSCEIEVGVAKNDTYGFQLDISKTQELLKEAIITAETKTIKPEWKIPAKCRGELNDIGDTYIYKYFLQNFPSSQHHAIHNQSSQKASNNRHVICILVL